MVSNMINFTTKLLIFLFFLSFTNATPDEDEDMAKCIKNVKRFCLTNRNHPDAETCIKALLTHWIKHQIPINGPFGNYYSTLVKKMDKSLVKESGLYCRDFVGEVIECITALTDFGNSTESAVTYALNDTTLAECRSNRFTLLYMEHIIGNVREGNVRPPWTHCKIKSYRWLNNDIDWSSYLRIENVEKSEEENDDEDTDTTPLLALAASAA